MVRRGLTLLAALLVVTVTPALAQYRIGMSAAITGPASSTYAPTYEAYKAYFKRVNDAGGINGQKVEITYEDRPWRTAARGRQREEVRRGLDLDGQRVDLGDVQPFMTESESEAAAPVRRRRLSARGVPAGQSADLLLDVVRLEVGQRSRSASSRSRPPARR